MLWMRLHGPTGSPASHLHRGRVMRPPGELVQLLCGSSWVVCCPVCWSTRCNKLCLLCRKTQAQPGLARYCFACYHIEDDGPVEHQCFYCRSEGADVQQRLCTFDKEACHRRVVVCDRCVALHDTVVCKKCWRRAWCLGCFRCKEKWARWHDHGRFCQKCFSLMSDTEGVALLLPEADEYLQRSRRPHLTTPLDGPALQLPALPINKPLPAYSQKAEFLCKTKLGSRNDGS